MRLSSIGPLIALLFVLSACSSLSREPDETVTIPPMDLTGIGPGEVTVSGDVIVRVGDDLAALVAEAEPGTEFVMASGLHRISAVTPKRGQTFTGESGAILSGAMVVDDFSATENGWTANVDVQSEPSGRCRDDAIGCRYPEQVFVDGQRWERVDTETPGRQQWALSEGRLTLGEDPAARQVELSHTPHAFIGGAEGVALRGLTIEKFATPAQAGAIQPDGGSGWIIEHNEIRMNHGAGVKLGPEMTIRRNFIHHNGQFGISGGGMNVRVEANEISDNNIAGFNPLWAAGGTKFVMTRDLVVKGNYVHDNDGPGLWTDIDNLGALITGNLVVDNAYGGIKHEISFDATIEENLVVGNGFSHPVPLRGAGILVRESSNVTVRNNRVLDNAHGVVGIQEEREQGPEGEYILEDLVVVSNQIDVGHGSTGVIENVGDPEIFVNRGIVFQDNTYLRADRGKPFLWDGDSLDLESWRRAENDTTPSGTQ